MTEKKRAQSFFGVTLMLLILFLCQSTAATAATREALRLASSTILPSLFPYLVLSGILSRSADSLSLPGGGAFGRIFRLPPCGYTAFFLGALCGFPIGARITAELYERGAIDRDAAARLSAMSTNAGPAFAVAGVGGALFGMPKLGWLLFLSQLIAAALLGLLLRKDASCQVTSVIAPAPFEISLPDILSRAVLSMLGIVGAVVFFGSLSSMISGLLPPFPASVLKALFEVGNGCAAAATFGKRGLPLAAFSLGFSGISVLLQAAGELHPRKIPVRPMIRFKILQGLLSALLILPFSLS